MSRFALASVLAAAATLALAAVGIVSCSKSAPSKDPPKLGGGPGADEVIAAPPGQGAPEDPGAVDPALRLKPDEGQLSIEVPPDAVAGKETTARVIVTPTSKYHINFEFSTKLKLKPPAEVAIPKPELKAGGQAKAKGDAETFEEKQLAFAVKLTPNKAGNHTINGMFKFAVCDKDQCLAKQEAIAIQVAAK